MIKYSLIVLLSTLLAATGFIVFLTTSPGEEFLRKQMVDSFNKRFDQVLQIEKLETNLLSRLQISGVTVSPLDSAITQLIDLKHVKIEYALFDLLDNNLTIDSLLIDSLNVNLDRDSTGSFNLPKPVTAPKPPEDRRASRFNLILERAEIRQSSLRFQDKTLSLNGTAGMVGSLVQSDEKGYNIETAIDSINLEYLDAFYSVKDFRLSGRYIDNTLSLDSVNMKIPGFDVTCDAELNLNDEPPSVVGKISLKGSPDQLAKSFAEYIPETLKPISGQLVMELSIEGSLQDPTLQAKIQFPKLGFQNLQVNDGNIELNASRRSIDIQHLDLNTMRGKVTGSGRLELDSIPYYDLNIDFKNLSLRDINKSILNQQAVYSGRVTGRLQSKGPLRSPELSEVKGELSVNRINFLDKSIPDLTVLVNSKNGSTELDIKQGDSRINSSIQYRDQKIKGTFSIIIPDLTPVAGLLNIEDVSGRLDMQGSIEGAEKSPEINVEFDGSDLRYSEIPIDKITGSLTYKNGELELGKTTLYGSLDDVNILNKPVDLSDFQGGINYKGEVSGRIDDLRGRLTIELKNPCYKEYKLEKGLVEATIDQKKVDLISLSLEDDSLRFMAEGSLLLETLTGDIQLDVLKKTDTQVGDENISDTLKPESMGTLSVGFDISNRQNITIDAEGTGFELALLTYTLKKQINIAAGLDFKLYLQGDLGNPFVRSEFHLADFRYNQVFLDSITGEAVFDGKTLNLGFLRFINGENHLLCGAEIELMKNADNRLSISTDSRISGYIRSESFNMANLAELIPLSLTYSGTVDCSLDFTGTINEPNINGLIILDNGSLIFPTTAPPLENLRMGADLTGSSVRIKNLSGSVRNKPFKLTGEISTKDRRVFKSHFDLTVLDRKALSGSGEIGFDSLSFDLVASDFDLTMLQGLNPNLSTIQGSLNSAVRLSGSLHDPYINGEIIGSEIQLKPEMIDAPLSNGTLKIRFDKKTVTLDSLFFRFKEGWLLSHGHAARQDSGFSSFTFQIHGENLNSRQPKKYILEIKSVDLNYNIEGEQYNLTGDIILGESRLLYRFQPQMLLSLLQKSDRPRRPLPEFLQKTRLNIRLRESDKIWVDNNLARMRLHSELAVTGSPAQLNINGRLMVAEGYIFYLDRKFQVLEGTLDFADPVKPNPYILLRAESDVRNYRVSGNDMYKIVLNISGTTEEPVINLYSDPPLDRPDILSLLTLGVTMDRPSDARSTGRGGALTGAVMERLEETSSARISGYVSRRTESVLGLDQVTVKGNLFNINNANGPQLLASKNLTDRMEVTYITTIGHINEQGIRLNYYLTRRFSVEGQTDQRGVSGIDLKYRIKF